MKRDRMRSLACKPLVAIPMGHESVRVVTKSERGDADDDDDDDDE